MDTGYPALIPELPTPLTESKPPAANSGTQPEEHLDHPNPLLPPVPTHPPLN